jgi:SAM-dependent methyltransferase
MKMIAKWLPLLGFHGSAAYWKNRYRFGGDSGAGSEGKAAGYKAAALNSFVRRYHVQDVIEFGCGDGRQLALSDYPQYLGLDVSSDAIAMCRRRFAEDRCKAFVELEDYRGERADLSLSLDVLYHLVEDDVYHTYLDHLFAAGRKFVIIYSTATTHVTDPTLRHVRHRPVDRDVAERYPLFVRMLDFEATLSPPVENGRGGWTRFFIYQRSCSAHE